MSETVNEAVILYIWMLTDILYQPVNWDIVDAATQDYRTDLTPEERFLAEFEVTLMRYANTAIDYDRYIAIVNMVRTMWQRLNSIEALAQAAATVTAMESRLQAIETRLEAVEAAS